MRELDRVVAGISCREVLDDLSDYVDGQLPAPRVQRIRDHLKDCDRCERFGGELAAAVSALRQALAEPEPLDTGVEERLRERLRAGRTPW